MEEVTFSSADPFSLAVSYLVSLDSDWKDLITRVGRCGLQFQPEREPYEALIRAVAYQQLHGRAAEAILKRFLALYPGERFPMPESILATDESLLRACGFSAKKISTIRGLAENTLSGIVPSRSAAKAMKDEELVLRLVSLRGIGRWTVEMFLIFTLERLDVLPAHDLGVREGWRVMKCLSKPPLPAELSRIGLAWSPYRSVATWYLWQAAEQSKRIKII